MKKYKEYMDRIGLSEEKHQQILDALAREEAEQTREDLPAARRTAGAVYWNVTAALS